MGRQDRSNNARKTIDTIKRKTHRKYSAEEKIRIVLEGLKGEETVAELCRREGLAQSLYYKWAKDFMEAGKARLTGDTKWQANSNEVKDLRRENSQLKQLIADVVLENSNLKKSLTGQEGDWEEG